MLSIESSYLNELDDLKKAYSNDVSRLEAMNDSISREFQIKTQENEVLQRKLAEKADIVEKISEENEEICRELAELKGEVHSLNKRNGALSAENQQNVVRLGFLQKNIAKNERFAEKNKENDILFQESLYQKHLQVLF